MSLVSPGSPGRLADCYHSKWHLCQFKKVQWESDQLTDHSVTLHGYTEHCAKDIFSWPPWKFLSSSACSALLIVLQGWQQSIQLNGLQHVCELCHHHRNLIPEHSSPLKETLYLLAVSAPSCRQLPIYLLSLQICLFWTFHRNGDLGIRFPHKGESQSCLYSGTYQYFISFYGRMILPCRDHHSIHHLMDIFGVLPLFGDFEYWY